MTGAGASLFRVDPPSDAPEQTIRRWLDEHGPVTVGQEAIAETWGLETMKAGDRRRIDAALADAGVHSEPSLRRAGRRDQIALSVIAEPAAPVAEPEEPAEPLVPAPADDEQEPLEDPRPSLPLRLAPLALVLMVIGSLGPWAKDIFVVDHGIERSGYPVIAAAAAAGLLLLLYARTRTRSLPLLLCIAIATATLVLLGSEYRELVDDQFVGPAWGIYAAFAGAAGIVAVSMALMVRR